MGISKPCVRFTTDSLLIILLHENGPKHMLQHHVSYFDPLTDVLVVSQLARRQQKTLNHCLKWDNMWQQAIPPLSYFEHQHVVGLGGSHLCSQHLQKLWESNCLVWSLTKALDRLAQKTPPSQRGVVEGRVYRIPNHTAMFLLHLNLICFVNKRRHLTIRLAL